MNIPHGIKNKNRKQTTQITICQGNQGCKVHKQSDLGLKRQGDLILAPNV